MRDDTEERVFQLGRLQQLLEATEPAIGLMEEHGGRNFSSTASIYDVYAHGTLDARIAEYTRDVIAVLLFRREISVENLREGLLATVRAEYAQEVNPFKSIAAFTVCQLLSEKYRNNPIRLDSFRGMP